MNIEVLAEGYQLVEAPRVDGRGAVWFTDVLGGGVHRWSDGRVDTVVPKRRGVGGLALHADGGIVVSGRDVVHVAPDGTNRQLFGAPEGVFGFNDLCATAAGAILVGALRFRPFAGDAVTPGEFWHVTAAGSAERVLDGVSWANGVGDDHGRWCFCDYHGGTVTMLRTGSSPTVLRTPSGEADGLAFDVDGGIWVAQPRAGSLVRFALDGAVDRTLDLPGHQPSSLAFDGDALYVTTIASSEHTGALLRLAAPVSGRRHYLATI